MIQVFKTKEPNNNLGSKPSSFKRENVKSPHYGIQSVRHLGPKIQDVEFNSLNEFKSLIEFWKPDT